MTDPLTEEVRKERVTPRQRFVLEETRFDEVPKKYRRFDRKWADASDTLAHSEAICPVCKVVVRSSRELRVGDRVYCMPGMSKLILVEGENGRLEAVVACTFGKTGCLSTKFFSFLKLWLISHIRGIDTKYCALRP